MQRHTVIPRSNWQQRCENLGFTFHSVGGVYWDESVYYSFDSSQIENLEKATNDLFEMCLEAVQHVIDRRRFRELDIDSRMEALCIESWENDQLDIYGRFDFSYDGIHPPKMLEFNADTPTALFEASVIQWDWLESTFPGKDQFNSIHEKLIAAWKREPRGTTHFACVTESEEDFITTLYMQDVCTQAGHTTDFLFMKDIGWDGAGFVDLHNRPIERIFKLYPWEWMAEEAFAQHLFHAGTRWIEPAWKLILTCKGILPILWELFPGHENLLPASFAPMASSVRKPLYSREGANIELPTGLSSAGDYGMGAWVHQQYQPLPDFSGNYPVIGSWVIGGESAGIGIREDNTLITKNTSRFVPHLVDAAPSLDGRGLMLLKD
ncbi:glutathionylspermidine synthase family protein [Deinococcus cellulosilyticus]|uniref:Glutathionylspermidine synthase pre-ATP-grasp-like domain-containing protein n=1 Tax=Deinococcus cellulosilyticus (strain DSM 18568 / NBRC 106333 / KACC 11606 / 5516J-15) TaxID=1223518 RepID=A0A511N802_DEIC1|nr:glutathionylspermidine synthase family protein [Deinococcus cellulosilyticus]GEM48965.1 hypothetical protein DC3_46000 [Deinococcus cellulosilyticus NBRC 106333 = KACC 11606]